MSTCLPLLGSMRFGDWGARLSPAGVADLLEAALDAGLDTLDLADIYGGHTTNALVGAAFALRPGLRTRFRLVAKIGIVTTANPINTRSLPYYDLSVAHLEDALAETQDTLGVEHVDMLMLHRFDPLLRVDEIAAWVLDLQREGRVGTFGVSNFDAHALARFDGLLPVAANQIELSLAHWAPLEDGTHGATLARDAEVQAWSPLGGGRLLDPNTPLGARLEPALRAMAAEFGTDPASLLLRWVATVPRTRAVLGSTRADRLHESAAACATPLPHDAWYALWEAARGHPVP